MSSVLAVKNAYKRFGETRALDGAELTLHEGEWLALLGPNGAGKTTLVRAIAGRVRLGRGQITLLGATRTAGARTRTTPRDLGVVPQDLALYPQLTAQENIEVFARLHGIRRPHLKPRVHWALDWTGLTKRAGERVKGFSGGMKRRLNIAAGVLHRPRVILLDEPTVGVDPQSRQRIWEMLEQLRQEGASLLLTTHQLDEAQQICERIVIIDHGKTIAAGTFDELLRQTIGTKRRLTLRLDHPATPEIRDLEIETRDGDVLRCSIDEPAADIPRILAAVQNAGAVINDLHLEAPTLQAVFIHLTGRELRE